VIVCTSANYVDINILAGLKGNTPLVVEVHSIFRQTIGCPGLRNRYADFMYRRGLKKAACIVVLTKIDAEDWRQIHPHVEVIPNIVHLNNGNISTLDNKRVIWVGRFDYQKRPMEMIDIWKMLHPRFPDWHLDIYGEGELRQELEAAAKIKDMNIHIHQPTEHIFDAYRDSSILVSTSLYEPFGLVIPEAMSCGLPVVAYDCPYGPGEIVTHTVDGFLVKKFCKLDFVEKCSKLIEEQEIRINMGRSGIESSMRFKSDKIIPQWIELFEKITN
jgi:glycosyltransferase involved in cell wall biosynthesis